MVTIIDSSILALDEQHRLIVSWLVISSCIGFLNLGTLALSLRDLSLCNLLWRCLQVYSIILISSSEAKLLMFIIDSSSPIANLNVLIGAKMRLMRSRGDKTGILLEAYHNFLKARL